MPKELIRSPQYGFVGQGSRRKTPNLAETMINKKSPAKKKKPKKSKLLPFKMPCPICKLGDLKVVEITMIPHRALAKTQNTRHFDTMAPPDQPLAA